LKKTSFLEGGKRGGQGKAQERTKKKGAREKRKNDWEQRRKAGRRASLAEKKTRELCRKKGHPHKQLHRKDEKKPDS